ncbi:MAG: DUF3473 domain-containing protein, partial [Prevotellaceae bacterium]|nr:DUF3473 domain-containing protein [Prevotellaceae bacterium]
FLGRDLVFSGGGYFRLFPYFLIKRWTQNSDYTISYLHPRDFDHSQPVIRELNPIRKFKSYTGLRYAKSKLKKWLNDFEFVDIHSANNTIDWENVPVIKL